MRILFLVALLLAQGPDPAHPFPNHEEPPVGWFCWPANRAEDIATDPHACNCVGMVGDDDPICESRNPDGSPPEPGVTLPPPNENARCKVWCHRDRCTCLRLCHES